MKKYLFIFIILVSCSSKYEKTEISIPDISFSENLSISEFKKKLDQYANNSPYPNIDD